MTITTNDVLFEEFLKIFPGSKVISESPLKAETTDDQWKRGRKEMARNKELVAAIIKANAEQLTLFLSGVQHAEQAKPPKSTPLELEKPERGSLVASPHYLSPNPTGEKSILTPNSIPTVMTIDDKKNVHDEKEKLSTGKILLAEELGGLCELSTGNNLTLAQSALLDDFLAGSEEIVEPPSFDSEAFLAGLDAEKEKLK